jgi:hypothetical protein
MATDSRIEAIELAVENFLNTADEAPTHVLLDAALGFERQAATFNRLALHLRNRAKGRLQAEQLSA